MNEQPLASPAVDTSVDQDTHLILGTAGHIDHGKSSLIKALTGVDPDRLGEEKRRGITIELGFAQLQLPDGTTMGVVDVPGHERFVRQMISGATGIDIALLCIAADDSIMPQTEEHLAILQLLDISSCVVAITKADLVDDEWLEFASSEIQARLSSTPYANAPIIATSSRSGKGLSELRNALVTVAREHRKTVRGATLRLPIDRVFSIKGSGTVVTGTLWSGTVSPDDEVEILPSGKTVRVRSVQVHGAPCNQASAGNRVALNFNAVTTDEVRPGDFLAAPGSITPTDHFDAHFTYLDSAHTGKPLESGTRIHLAHGTREVIGRILFIDHPEPLKPQESTFVQFRLEEPLTVSRKDRFIVRSYSPVAVLGGGSVLRSHPRRKTRLGADEITLLETIEQGNEPAMIRSAALLETAPFTAEKIASTLEVPLPTTHNTLATLTEEETIARLEDQQRSPWYFSLSTLRKLLAKIENLLIAFHSENPEQPGISKSNLMQKIDKRMDPAAFDALLIEAQKRGKIVTEEGIISHPQAGAGAKVAEKQAGEALLEQLTAAAYTPPTTQDLIAGSGVEAGLAQRALTSLEKQGLVTRITKELYFETSAYQDLLSKAEAHLKVHTSAPATELKEAMGVSRKYAIPLLEHFDSQRITLREGDERRLA